MSAGQKEKGGEGKSQGNEVAGCTREWDGGSKDS